MATQQTAEIKETLQQRLDNNPRTLDFTRLADIFRKEGDLEKAVQISLKGLEHHPKNVVGHLILGRCYLEQQNTDAAIEEFRTVCGIDRRNVVALKMLADIYTDKGMDQKADYIYVYLTQLMPDDPTVKDRASRVTHNGGKEDVYDIIGLAKTEGKSPTQQEEEQTSAAGADHEAEEIVQESDDEVDDTAGLDEVVQQQDSETQPEPAAAQQSLDDSQGTGVEEEVLDTASQGSLADTSQDEDLVQSPSGTISESPTEEGAAPVIEEIVEESEKETDQESPEEYSDVERKIDMIFEGLESDESGEREKKTQADYETAARQAPRRVPEESDTDAAAGPNLPASDDVSSRIDDFFSMQESAADTESGHEQSPQSDAEAKTAGDSAETVQRNKEENGASSQDEDAALHDEALISESETVVDEGLERYPDEALRAEKEEASQDKIPGDEISGIDPSEQAQSSQEANETAASEEETVTTADPTSESLLDNSANELQHDDADETLAVSDPVVSETNESTPAGVAESEDIEQQETAEEETAEEETAEEETAGEETAEEEPAEEETAEEETAEEEPAGEEPAGEEPAGEETAGEETAGELDDTTFEDVDETLLENPLQMEDDQLQEEEEGEESSSGADEEAPSEPVNQGFYTLEGESAQQSHNGEPVPDEIDRVELDTSLDNEEEEDVEGPGESLSQQYTHEDEPGVSNTGQESDAESDTTAISDESNAESQPDGKNKEEENTLHSIPDHVLTPTLGDLYFQQGQHELALSVFRRLHERDPENEKIGERLQEIEDEIAEEQSGEEGGTCASGEEPDTSYYKTDSDSGYSSTRTQSKQSRKKSVQARRKSKKPLKGVRIKEEYRQLHKRRSRKKNKGG